GSAPAIATVRRTAYAAPTIRPSSTATRSPAGSKFGSSRTESRNRRAVIGSRGAASVQLATRSGPSPTRNPRISIGAPAVDEWLRVVDERPLAVDQGPGSRPVRRIRTYSDCVENLDRVPAGVECLPQ